MHTLRDHNRQVFVGITIMITIDWATDKCRFEEELNWKRRTTSE